MRTCLERDVGVDGHQRGHLDVVGDGRRMVHPTDVVVDNSSGNQTPNRINSSGTKSAENCRQFPPLRTRAIGGG